MREEINSDNVLRLVIARLIVHRQTVNAVNAIIPPLNLTARKSDKTYSTVGSLSLIIQFILFFTPVTIF